MDGARRDDPRRDRRHVRVGVASRDGAGGGARAGHRGRAVPCQRVGRVRVVRPRGSPRVARFAHRPRRRKARDGSVARAPRRAVDRIHERRDDDADHRRCRASRQVAERRGDRRRLDRTGGRRGRGDRGDARRRARRPASSRRCTCPGRPTVSSRSSTRSSPDWFSPNRETERRRCPSRRASRRRRCATISPAARRTASATTTARFAPTGRRWPKSRASRSRRSDWRCRPTR